MKKFFAGTAAALLAAVLFFPLRASAVSAQKAILYDPISGRTLVEKDADSRSLIASTTKMMTALLICEQCNVLDRMRVPKAAVGIEGSSMYLREGEVLTIQDLLYGLMLASGNDAAVALAIYCGGTVEGFTEMMNDKARMLGLQDSHFVNPHGLDSPEHYSTAKDLAVLAAYAMDNPIFSKTVSTRQITVAGRRLRNHNKLLWSVGGADGVKTGYTKASGRILVSSAVRDSRRLVAVTINDPDDWRDHASLIDDGFRQYHLVEIVAPGAMVGELQVIGGEQNRIELIAEEAFSYPLADYEKAQLVYPGMGFAYAPLVHDSNAGSCYILVGGKAVGKISVSYGQTVEQKQDENRGFLKKIFGG